MLRVTENNIILLVNALLHSFFAPVRKRVKRMALLPFSSLHLSCGWWSGVKRLAEGPFLFSSRQPSTGKGRMFFFGRGAFSFFLMLVLVACCFPSFLLGAVKNDTTTATRLDLPAVYSAVQFVASLSDAVTTDMCIREGEVSGFRVYESNPMVSMPFGDQPTLPELIAFNAVETVALYAVSRLIHRYAPRVSWLPQVTMSAVSINQARWNYGLYKRLQRAGAAR